MNIGKFIAKVKAMRHSQREYFMWRSSGWLQRAKAEEKEVDDMIEDYYADYYSQRIFDD